MASESYLTVDNKATANDSSSFDRHSGSNASSAFRPAGAWRRFFARTFEHMASESYLTVDNKANANDSSSFNRQSGSNTSSTFRPAGAWRRFFARTFDSFCIYMPLLSILFIVVLNTGLNEFTTGNGFIVFALICVPLSLLLESGLYALIKTTPGKFFLGIEVHDSHGKKISPIDYAFRNAEVYTSGLFLGIPVLQIFPMVNQFIKIQKNGRSSYDDKSEFNVICKSSLVKTLIFAGLYACMLFLTAVINQVLPSLMPHTSPVTSQTHYANSVWTNRVTGTTANIDGDWSIEETENDGISATTFVSKTHDVSVILVHEYTEMTLENYVNAFHAETNEYKPLGPGKYYRTESGNSYWVGTGFPKNNNKLNYATTILKNENSFWRIITILPDNDTQYDKAYVLEDTLTKTFPN